MKKTVALLLAALCLLTALTGCGGSKKKTLEPRSFVDELMTQAKFTDSLNELDAKVVPILYNISESDYKSAIVYAGTAATAEEIAVFEATDDAAADRLLEAAKARVASQIETYKSYGPAQAMTLENGTVVKTGSYVIVVICTDTEGAKKVTDKYI